MVGRLYYNSSDKRYLIKNLSQIGNDLTVDLIEPTSVTDPDIILAPGTEIMKANYIWLQDFGRYYYINNYTFEYERIIAHCHVDVLQSFAPEIIKEKVVFDRSNENIASKYLNDDQVKMYNYSLFKTINFDPKDSIYFDDETEQIVMVCSGSL